MKWFKTLDRWLCRLSGTKIEGEQWLPSHTNRGRLVYGIEYQRDNDGNVTSILVHTDRNSMTLGGKNNYPPILYIRK